MMRINLDREFLTDVYSRDLKKITEINLMGKQLDCIVSSAFDRLKNLNTIRLTSDNIRDIGPNSFKDLVNLVNLSLDNNRLSSLRAGTFTGLKNLKNLSLCNNQITEIEPNALEPLVKLERLLLSRNALVKLEIDLLEKQTNLVVLDLEFNQLRSIHPYCLRNLNSIAVVKLANNPWEIADQVVSYYNLSNLPDQFECNLTASEASKTIRDWNQFRSLLRKCEEAKRLKDSQKENKDSEKGKTDIQEDKREKNQVETKGSQNKSIKETELKNIKPIMAPRVDSPMTNPLISKESQTKDSGLRIVHPLTSSPDVQTSLFDPLIGRLLDHYEVHGLLGEGAYGRVYRVRDVSENIDKAMKVMKLVGAEDSKAEAESNLLKSITHKNIIRYFDHFQVPDPASTPRVCIIMEFCCNGDLAGVIRKKQLAGERFTSEEIFKWMLQASDGLRFLHERRIMHRDVKPGNMLLDKENTLKLGDMGEAKLVLRTGLTNTQRGTIPYMSPEQLDNAGKYSYNSDIWY